MQAEIHLVFLCFMGVIVVLLALCMLGIWWSSR